MLRKRKRKIFANFKLHFHNEGLHCERNYFEIFFYNWPLVSSCKISGFTVQPFSFFVKKMPYLSSYLCGKYLSTKIFTFLHQSKKELSDLDQNWAKTRHLLFKTWKSSISMDSPIVCTGSACFTRYTGTTCFTRYNRPLVALVQVKSGQSGPLMMWYIII